MQFYAKNVKCYNLLIFNLKLKLLFYAKYKFLFNKNLSKRLKNHEKVGQGQHVMIIFLIILLICLIDFAVAVVVVVSVFLILKIVHA